MIIVLQLQDHRRVDVFAGARWLAVLMLRPRLQSLQAWSYSWALSPPEEVVQPPVDVPESPE